MTSLFEHPDAQSFFDTSYSMIMRENDRGCVLLGASLLDEELRKMFESFLPPTTSGKRKKDIFNSQGPFGSLSSKLDIAYTCRLLPNDIVNCVHLLRKMRNNLAHQVENFSLIDNLDNIFQIFNKTNGDLAPGIAAMSVELVVQQFVEKSLDTVHPIDDGKKLFESEKEALDFLNSNDKLKTDLAEQRVKLMFALGIAVLGALIIIHREKAKELIDGKA
ncbi:MAG TPA: hypothetical protein DEP04_02905 [Dehalococcoidia bacterium]|nr:hypothetical protein [Dehalococcoidia bacterium]